MKQIIGILFMVLCITISSAFSVFTEHETWLKVLIASISVSMGMAVMIRLGDESRK